MKTKSIAQIIAIVAGTMDFVTGAGLLIAPVLTLRAMTADVPVFEALPFVRFIGVFVASVGLNYLWGAFGPARRLNMIFISTGMFRFAAGTFTTLAVITKSLPNAWAIVALVDLSLVVIQWWLVSKAP